MQSEGDEAMVSAALMALEVPPEAYHLGRTRVFFKTGQLAYVRKILDVRGLSLSAFCLLCRRCRDWVGVGCRVYYV